MNNRVKITIAVGGFIIFGLVVVVASSGREAQKAQETPPDQAPAGPVETPANPEQIENITGLDPEPQPAPEPDPEPESFIQELANKVGANEVEMWGHHKLSPKDQSYEYYKAKDFYVDTVYRRFDSDDVANLTEIEAKGILASQQFENAGQIHEWNIQATATWADECPAQIEFENLSSVIKAAEIVSYDWPARNQEVDPELLAEAQEAYGRIIEACPVIDDYELPSFMVTKIKWL